jgi:[ribosomal protein S5]-alanine N-acetyltransferase
VTSVRLRAVDAGDLPLLRRFATEPGLIGPNWYGFRDAGAVDRRFAEDGFLGKDGFPGNDGFPGKDGGRLMVDVDGEPGGFVGWRAMAMATPSYWSIGIVLLPEFRGRGAGMLAQGSLCAYLFAHTPAQRIEAATQPENIAEQKALEKIGFQREGVLRSAEFRDGAWRDVVVFGKVRG